jgi:ribosomal protein S21
MINVEVKLDKKKSLEKPYFDKMWNKFNREVQRSFILEELKLKRCYYKPSRFKRLKKDISKLKWRYY